MVKVRYETITLRVPVIDNSGDHDAKIDPAVFAAIQDALAMLQAEYAPVAAAIAAKPVSSGASPGLPGEWIDASGTPATIMSKLLGTPPTQQVDPPINTAVSDREMRSSAPEMSLEEFREPPERTRSPPRPRRNSWRHDQ